MTKTKKKGFTPGPWHIKPAEMVTRTFRSLGGRQCKVQTRIAILDSTKQAYRPYHTVCQITMGNPCHEGNARLLRRAPEMYALLTYIWQQLDMVLKHPRDDVQEWWRDVLLPIAKDRADNIKDLLEDIDGK